MSRFFVVSALYLRNRAAGSSARRHMTSPVCGGEVCRTKYCGSALCTVCRRDPALRRTRASLLRVVFGQRHSVGMRLRVCFGQKDRCGASARRKVELHGQLLLPRKREGAGWTARVRFLYASADKLLRVKWAAGMRFAAYAAEGGAIFRAVLSVCAEKHLSDSAFVIIRGKFALIFP